MRRHWAALVVLMIAGPGVVYSGVPERPPRGDGALVSETPEQLIDGATDLVERNSGDSLGASRAEIEEAVARILAALRRGFRDRRTAYELLARAYHSFWSRAAVGEAETLAIRAKEADAYRMLRQLDPEDPEWDISYVEALVEDSQRVAALEKIVRARPRHAPARAWLGLLYCEAGKREQAVQQMVEAAKVLTEEQYETTGATIVNGVQECAGLEAALRVKRIVDEHRPREPR